jgi:hypothetical protein
MSVSVTSKRKRIPTIANAKRNGIDELNEILHKKCSQDYTFELKLYKYIDLDLQDIAVYSTDSEYDIILCLNYNGKCISSVAAKYDEEKNEIEIASKTLTEHEGKKFNLYLRLAFVYVMTFARPHVKSILSNSVNPISTYTMYKYFNAQNGDLAEFVKTFNKTPETFTLDNAIEFHRYANKYTQTHESARKIAEEMLEDVSMEELGWTSIEDGIEYVMDTAKNSPSVVSLSFDIPINRDEYRTVLLEKMQKVDISCGELKTITTRSQTKRKFSKISQRGGSNKNRKLSSKRKTRRT